MSDETYDVVVVGGGAAGLAAALPLGRSRRSVLVVDSGEPRNAPAAGVHNYLGREGVAPGDLTAIGRAEVEAYGVVVRSGVVADASSHPGSFRLGLDDGTRLRARRVIVASGVTDELPDVAGLRQRWGRDVLHCPYCHGWEVRDRRLGVLAVNEGALHQVQLLRQLSDDVVLLANDVLALHHHQEAEVTARGIEVVSGQVTEVLVDDDRLTGVRLADGTTVALDALAVFTRQHARAEVPTMLGLETVEQRYGDIVMGDVVPADATGATAVPGLWVAGNVADLRATTIVAAASGTNAGAAVNADLVAEEVRLALMAQWDGTPEFWEGFYADRDQIWSGDVNPVLAATAAELKPGTALDLGAGEGGDALWLAREGWTVTATDVSQTACDRIAAAAGALPLTAERHDLTVSFPAGEFDLVSASYLHSPHPGFDRTAILRRAAEAVAPGGTLLVTGHGRMAPRSWDPSLHLPTAAEVLAALALDDGAWEVVRSEGLDRAAAGHAPGDHHHADVTDEIVQVRRRA